jgi:site-specific DNA-methyltransferase (adenine-specific)
MSKLHNIDCMEYLATLEDNAFELAIVDPPYGIDVTKMTLGNGRKKIHRGMTNWDAQTPSKEYFSHLFRVSRNQIIWGANYMTPHLPASMGWVYWDKGTGENDFSDGELAFTSFHRALRSFKKSWVGANANNGTARIHPTEKPIKLYEWLLMNYAKQGDRILDTHLGSGSIAIACHNLGFDLVGCELDTDYFKAAQKRLKQHQSQLRIPMQ